jgi:hypothetical protein
MDILASANAARANGRPAAAAAAVAPTKGQRKGHGKGAHEILLSAVIPLLTAHERAINDLLDRSSFVCVLKDETLKTGTETVRKHWKSESPKDPVPAAAAAASGDQPGAMQVDKPAREPHPLGSQRSVLHRLFFEMLLAEAAPEHPSRVALEFLSKLDAAQVDAAIFRLKPRHQTLREGMPWAWAFLLKEEASEQYRAALTQAKAVRSSKIFVAPQHSHDGPLVKFLLDFKKNAEGGSGVDAYGHKRQRH